MPTRYSQRSHFKQCLQNIMTETKLIPNNAYKPSLKNYSRQCLKILSENPFQTILINY